MEKACVGACISQLWAPTCCGAIKSHAPVPSPVKDGVIRGRMAVLLTSPGGNCKSIAVLYFIVSVMLEVEPRAEYIPDH